ncbi:MAG TPA: hydrolase 1, exosortase A system-associated [Burkholderiaceae bacterium]|nr:hydrolase 1, exosortase A system-associated [Burkholderiaceae bacterium]
MNAFSPVHPGQAAPLAWRERPLWISCGVHPMLGILAEPTEAVRHRRGVLIVVGGPQYRVGSHRQFVLLARHLATAGYSVLRFDYRGMGDSEGDRRDFEHVEDDLRAASQALFDACPSLDHLALWGLCDAASAIAMSVGRDPRVDALVLLNPWVRHETSLATAQIKHYYRDRFFSAEFWRKLLSGGVDWRDSWRGFMRSLTVFLKARSNQESSSTRASFQTRMVGGLRGFSGSVLVILSGRDLTAQEFITYTATASEWSGVLSKPSVRTLNITNADHTFSSREWRSQVESATLSWLDELNQARNNEFVK